MTWHGRAHSVKVLLLAGEASGLIYADRLRELLSGHEVRGYSDYGFETHDLAVMGFWPVLRRLFYFLRVKRTMERAIDEWRPDVVCTIDYPGMNLKLDLYARCRGIRTLHVVCPQVWAWKSGRIPKIEASVDRLCCFFPFEPALFTPGFAEFVGHPLAEDFARDRASRPSAGPEKGLVAILPGSRLGEIEKHLPTMLSAVALLEGVRVAIPAANERALAAIRRIVSGFDFRRGGSGSGGTPEVSVQLGGARDVLCRAECAVVASGTATLEAALARCPTVLVYRVSAALAWFARRVIKGVRHIGLANVIWEKSGEVGEEPMPELLQEDFTAERVAAELSKWLKDPSARARAAARLDAVVGALETDGSAFARIAGAVLSPPDR